MPTHNPPKTDTTKNLKPYGTTPEAKARAKAAGIKSGEVRRANKQAKELAQTTNSTDLHNHLTKLVTTFKRDQLPQTAAAAAQYLIAKVISGHIEITGKDVAPLIATLVDVARLEEGQSTSNAVVAHMSSKEALDRLTLLRQEQGASNTGPTVTTVPELVRGTPNTEPVES